MAICVDLICMKDYLAVFLMCYVSFIIFAFVIYRLLKGRFAVRTKKFIIFKYHMTHTITSKYLGNLRTESLHLRSQSKIITDAPVDNNGKGEAFSPTDLLATSLATCMFTIMGIVAQKNQLNIDNAECKISKIMSQNLPRKVVEVVLEFDFLENNFDENQKEILRQAAYSCPVALSVHDDLKKTVIFNFD